jgi:serine/threonine protein kinase
VSAFALEKVDGLGLCIVMEFIEGSTLKEWLQGETQRQTRQRIARELTEAVGYIHTKGIVHRDLKPENIIITHNGENVKLIDFGLADTDSHAVLKQPAGTPRYMSPEQMQDSVADVRNDIYSLGIIFQQMKLGLGYRSIIKRCIQPIDRRYHNVQTLQKTVVRQKACVRWGMILAVALILLITIGALVALGLRQKEQNTFIREQQGITATQQTQIKQQRQKMDSLQQQVGEKVGEVTDYQKRQQKKEEEELHQQQSQERMSNAFMAGIDSLRKAVKADGSSIDERYHRGQYAIEHFMQTQTHGLTKKEKEEVRTSLIQNLDAYMRVWKKTEEQLNRMQNEYNNPTTD